MMTASEAPPQGRPEHPGLWANSGGPMSRSRVESVRSTLLGSTKLPIHCPRKLSLALDFESSDPWTTIHELLEARGLSEPEALRAVFTDIPGPMLARVRGSLTAIKVSGSPPDAVLRQALLLGLCTAVFYDPTRPVIWTRASLTCRLSLYDTTGFYA